MLANAHLLVFLILFLGPKWLNGQNGFPAMTLNECIETALQNNRMLQAGKTGIQLSESRLKEAKWQQWPKVNINGEYRYYTNLPYQLLPLSVFGGPEGQFREAQFGVPHTLNTQVQWTMPIYSAQVQGGKQAAKTGMDMAALQHLKSVEQVIFDLSNLYYNAQILHYQMRYLSDNIRNAAKMREQAELLYQQQLAKATDVSRVALQLQQLTTQQANLQAQFEQVLLYLKQVMGLPPEKELAIDTTIASPVAQTFNAVPTSDIRLIQTKKSLLQIEQNTLRKTRLIPAVHFVGAYGFTGFGYDGKPEGFLRFYPLGFAGIQFSYPIFNGPANQRQLDQKGLEILNQELLLDWNQSQTETHLKNAFMQQTTAQANLKATDQQIAFAQSIYDQTLLQQKQGTATLTDVLLADQALREAQQTRIQHLIQFLKAELEIKKHSGNLQLND
jgi:outer membrane protein TolC